MPSERPLAPDATIADVFGKIAPTNHPDIKRAFKYLGSVLRTLKRLRAEHGEVVVRIGITGTGYDPFYRVDHAGSGRPIEAFDGSQGQPWTDPNGQPWTGQHDPQNWSRRCMTYDEVFKLDKQFRARLARRTS